MKSSVLFRILFFTIVIPSATLFFSCIERKNPWDPANGCSEIILNEIHNNSKGNLLFIANKATVTYSKIMQYVDSFKNIKISNDSIRIIVDKQKHLADSIKVSNSAIHASNKTAECKNLLFKNIIQPIPNFYILTKMSDIDYLRDSLSKDSLRVSSIISHDNNECFPQGVYSTQTSDSIMSHYSTLIDSTDRILTELKTYNSSISDTNKLLIQKLNTEYTTINKDVFVYNDSIRRVMLYCDRIWLSDRGQIFNKLNNFKPGDTLLLDSGSIKADIRLNYIGDSIHPTIIEGSPFMNTRLDTSNFAILESRYVIIRNIIFSSGTECNMTVDNGKNIRFENCQFINSKKGIDIIRSEVYLTNCIIVNNKVRGLYCTDFSRIDMKNILISQNKGNGIEIINSEAKIANSTITDNSNAGIYLINQKRPIFVIHSLVTFNNNMGFFRERSEDKNLTEFYYSSFYGNLPKHFSADSNSFVFDSSCLYSDPVYTNRSSADYTISNTSELFNKGWGYKP